LSVLVKIEGFETPLKKDDIKQNALLAELFNKEVEDIKRDIFRVWVQQIQKYHP
jgi:hypothetical protein